MTNTKKNIAKVIALCLLLGVGFCPVYGEDLGGLKTSVAVDIVGQAGLSPGSGASGRLDVREAEFLLYAPADHLFDGLLNLAAHTESGIVRVEIHEAYIGSSKLIPRSRFRIGHFFLGVGRINQIHRHDWPFISAPRYHQLFFADEAAQDSGIEYTYLAPLPFFLELTGGITNGYIFGHDHSAGSTPQIPTHYLRAATYFSLPWEGGTQIGFNYLGRKTNEGIGQMLVGIDATAKWRSAQILGFLFQSEFWYRTLTTGSDVRRQFGFYLFPQLHLGGGLFLGTRLDYFSEPSLADAFGDPISNYDINFVPTLTYRSSEFALFRLAYGVRPRLDSGGSQTSHMLELQTVFFLGAHPAHDF